MIGLGWTKMKIYSLPIIFGCMFILYLIISRAGLKNTTLVRFFKGKARFKYT